MDTVSNLQSCHVQMLADVMLRAVVFLTHKLIIRCSSCQNIYVMTNHILCFRLIMKLVIKSDMYNENVQKLNDY